MLSLAVLVCTASLSTHAPELHALRAPAGQGSDARPRQRRKRRDRSQRDSDRDGISDAVERRTGTDPYNPDTDGDGIPDGVEDANADGIVDPGESDPRVPGLFPGRYPHIPEPLVFDLVRGLDADKGEIEVNTLVLIRPTRKGAIVDWAPEVEWAFARGHAIEFELPMVNDHVHAIKLALQGTFPDRSMRFIHGWQLIAEQPLADGTEFSWLYLAGGRPGGGNLSLFTMVGLMVLPTAHGREVARALVNPSVFTDFSETITVGLETNWSVGHRHFEGLVMPQIHWQIGRRFRLHIGGGVAAYGRSLLPVVSTRVILE